MDPEVKRYFIKILNSFSLGLIWMISASTFAFYFGLGIVHDSIRTGNIIFYLVAIGTLFLLIRYYYRVWREQE